MKKEKNKQENKIEKSKKNKEKKVKNNKNEEKKPNKFIETIKKKWLIDGTKTTILVIIIIAIFIAINVFMHSLELTPLDFTQEKLYSLTDESKEKVKKIDKNINIYFVGYSEDSTDLDLAKQYHKVNEKIVVEAVNAESRPDLVEKYGIQSGSEGIIVECENNSKVLSSSDLVTYDTTTYETVSIAEEKLTSTILTVASSVIPKIYFLQGYSEFILNYNMNYLNTLLSNEVNEVETLDILSVGKVPEDCSTLVITTPTKDFDDVATNAIKNYINAGGNILWLNSAITTNLNLTNVNSILEAYGVKPFEAGIIRETNANKMIAGSPDFIIPELQYHTITKDIYSTTGVVLVNATKINIDDDKLSEQNVVKTELAKASEGSYFRTNFNNQNSGIEEGEEKGPFLLGAELQKEIKAANEETGEKAITSKMVIYSENYFITDYPLNQNYSQYPVIQLAYNKDLILNSIAYLTDREEDIVIRKDTGTVTYTATQAQDTTIRIIIFAVPIAIILIGIIVWQRRRRKK